VIPGREFYAVGQSGGRGAAARLDNATGQDTGHTDPEEAEECAAVETMAVRAGHDVVAPRGGITF
jgi:hypothetical protein